MNNFINQMGDDATDSGKKGWLVAILELGAWFGVLWTGFLCDKLSRKRTIVTGGSFPCDPVGAPRSLPALN